MGAAPAGEPGEAWGYRQLPLAVGAAEVGSRALAFGPPLRSRAARAPARLPPLHRRQRLAGLRHAGRRVRQPLPRARCPNRLSARITRDGRGRAGRPRPDPAGGRTGGRPRPRPRRRLAGAAGAAARTSCCRPKANGPAEALAGELGAGAVADRRLRRGRPHRPLLRPDRALGRRRGHPLRRRRMDAASRSKSRSARRTTSTSSRSTRPGSATPGRSPKPTESLGRSVVLLQRTDDPGRAALGRARPRRRPFADRDDAGAGNRRRWPRSAAPRSR